MIARGSGTAIADADDELLAPMLVDGSPAVAADASRATSKISVGPKNLLQEFILVSDYEAANPRWEARRCLVEEAVVE